MALPNGWKVGPDRVTHESGQAFVFQVVRDGDPGDVYALKRLKNPERRSRFAREVTTMRELSSSGASWIANVVEVDLDGDHPYFVMPWYADGSLQDKVDAGSYRDDPTGGLNVLTNVAEALASLHDAGVAHRDVKPANVLVDGDCIVLADLGLCLHIDDDADRITATHEAVGSRLYIAPENESGMSDAVDQRPADFYAFAKLLWALLAGRTPPARENQLEASFRLETICGINALAALDPLQERLLARDPRVRLADWQAVIDELRTAQRALSDGPAPRDRSSLDRVLEAARRLPALPTLTDPHSRALTSQQVENWRDRELAEVFSAAAGRVDVDQLASINDASQGLVAVGQSLGALLLPHVVGCTGAVEGRVPGYPDLTSYTNAPAAFEARTDSASHGFPALVVATFVGLQGQDMWFTSVPYLRPDNGSWPVILHDEFFVDGPYPAMLTQTLEAAGAFVDMTTEAFLKLLERYLEILEIDADPVDLDLWTHSSPATCCPGWQRAALLDPPRSHLEAAHSRGRIIIVGGQPPGGGALRVTAILDPNESSVVAGPLLDDGRIMPMCTSLSDGTVFVAGGESGGRFLASTIQLEPGTDAWQTCAPLPEPRADGGLVTLDLNTLLLVGGNAAVQLGDASVLAYLVDEDRWESRSPLPTPMRGLAIAVGNDGRVFAFGGLSSDGGGVYFPTTHIYDPTSDVWDTGPPMPTSRAWASAVTTTGDEIWVLGGHGPTAPAGVPTTLASVDIFDPKSGLWRSGPRLPRARSSFAAIEADGRIYVMGGESAGVGPLASVVVHAAPDANKAVL